ncbi:MAG: hypothetical protein NTV22_00280 [bacterium]|nr:hypothetical protein [bacterium]
MNRIMLRCGALCAVLFALAVAAGLRAEVVEVTIFHTTDLHGNFAPVTDYEGHAGVGGTAGHADELPDARPCDD